MFKNLEIYQWLAPLIAIYYIIRTFRQYKKGKYSPRNTVIWIIFWFSLMLLALVPDTVANSLAHGLGFKDHINALIFVALGILFLMIFYLSAAINRVENKMTELVRRIALERITFPSSKKSVQKKSSIQEESVPKKEIQP